MSKAVIFFADGFEECEGLLVVDLLRRGKIHIETASVNGKETVLSSHNVEIKCDKMIEDVDFSDVDIVVLPGGIPGVDNLLANETVCKVCREFAATRKLAAVCAGPGVPGQLGLLKGKKATIYPGFDDRLVGAEYTAEAVTVDGNIITGRALGACFEFTLEIIKALEGEEKAAEVAAKICYTE